MKEEIDKMIALYGSENAPPPWSTFTIANTIQEGNMHVVQKVFEGPFEVGLFLIDHEQHTTPLTCVRRSLI